MTKLDAVSIMAGAVFLCSPLWAAWLMVRWLDRRPTKEQRFARNHQNVLRQRGKINKHLFNK